MSARIGKRGRRLLGKQLISCWRFVFPTHHTYSVADLSPARDEIGWSGFKNQSNNYLRDDENHSHHCTIRLSFAYFPSFFFASDEDVCWTGRSLLNCQLKIIVCSVAAYMPYGTRPDSIAPWGSVCCCALLLCVRLSLEHMMIIISNNHVVP